MPEPSAAHLGAPALAFRGFECELSRRGELPGLGCAPRVDRVSMHEAQTGFWALVLRAEAGEGIVIHRHGRPGASWRRSRLGFRRAAPRAPVRHTSTPC